MTGLGSGDNGEITFLDLLTIAGFLVGIENLNLNATQNDVQAVAQTLAEKSTLCGIMLQTVSLFLFKT